MSEERKKATPKPVAKVEPKKRVEPEVIVETPKKKVEPKQPVVKPEVKKVEPKIVLNTDDTDVKVKRAENKYVRVALDAKAEERNQFTAKVKNGELKYAYYATDSDKGYHYYLVLKK
jgi:hypothetical protein